MSESRIVLFYIIISKLWSCTHGNYWGTFVHTGPVTLNYYRWIPNSSLLHCIADCWTFYNWDQIYFQGKNCYCLAPGFVTGTGTVTANLIWTSVKDDLYCTEKEYTIFPDQGYCLKFFSTRKVWEDAHTRCRQDGGYLISVYTQQDFTNFRSLYTHDRKVYVGARRKLNGTEYFWTTGGTVQKSFWNTGEPNNHRGLEECASVLETGQFYDKPCNKQDCFICQIFN